MCCFWLLAPLQGAGIGRSFDPQSLKFDYGLLGSDSSGDISQFSLSGSTLNSLVWNRLFPTKIAI